MAAEFEWNQAKTTSSRWSWLGCFVLQTVAVQNNVSGVTAPLDTKCLNANRWRQTIWASLAVSSDIYFQHCFLFVLHCALWQQRQTLAYIHTLLTFPTTSCLSLCFRLIMFVLLESKVRRTKPNSKNGKLCYSGCNSICDRLKWSHTKRKTYFHSIRFELRVKFQKCITDLFVLGLCMRRTWVVRNNGIRSQNNLSLMLKTTTEQI